VEFGTYSFEEFAKMVDDYVVCKLLLRKSAESSRRPLEGPSELKAELRRIYEAATSRPAEIVDECAGAKAEL
jgi:hypothetical protein